jgi:hypothetical protein
LRSSHARSLAPGCGCGYATVVYPRMRNEGEEGTGRVSRLRVMRYRFRLFVCLRFEREVGEVGEEAASAAHGQEVQTDSFVC